VVCDLSIASAEHGKFKQTDADVGSFDAGYGSAYFARQIGQKFAREVFFLAREYSAQRAYEMGAVNAVVPHARARLNIRAHPEQDAAEAQAAVIRHLEAQRPFGVPLSVDAGATGNGFATGTGGPAYKAAIAAKKAAWGVEPLIMASGGSIPLVSALQEAVPEAEILLLGATDGYSNIHAPDERVLLDEFEKAIVAEADFFGLFAEG
jgi:acetylornithine deacetylase/succinyl-diaminopimelate desuccinylase-like protein